MNENKGEKFMDNNTGVYAITHLDTGAVYVGASTNIAKRKYNHFRQLHLNKHYCKSLQADFNESATGNSAVSFEVLEYCDRDALREREKFHIDASDLSYNTRSHAGVGCFDVSDERREQMRDKLIGVQIYRVGTYITPWGSYTSSIKAAKECEPTISQPAVYNSCTRPDREITRLTYARSRYLQANFDKSIIGKTWKELGFGFIAQHTEPRKKEKIQMTKDNIINFPTSEEFEDLSLSERMLILKSWHEEMEDNLTRIRQSTAEIAALMAANKKHMN